MAIRQIAQIGEPVLRKKSKVVEKFDQIINATLPISLAFIIKFSFACQPRLYNVGRSVF